MRYLPLVIARGPMLAQLVRDAAQDPRRVRLCDCCGARMATAPGPTAMARCPACQRRQPAVEEPETPWRLTTAAAERLRRIKSWPRWL